MAVVPYTFANQAGQIPLSELDVNFANVKAFAETAGNVTGNTQANITAVGNLTTLRVVGNIVAARLIGNVTGNVTGSVTGNVTGNISGNFIVPGANTQVLFNDTGLANATSGMTFNKITNSFVVSGAINSASLLTTGNIQGANIVSLGLISVAGIVTATDTITGGNVATSGTVSATGTVTGGNIATAGQITATGTVTGGNLTTSGTVSATGTITGGNLTTSGTVSTTGTITGGNLTTAGTISAAGNISGGNIIGTIVGTVSTTSVSAAGNVTGGNILTSGIITATGNITGGNILTAGRVSLSGNLTASGNTALSGNATAPTAANGTSTTQIATTAFVVNAITNSAIPAGVILLWSGSLASIPSGWALCNGANGTPDLRNRFVVGAGSTYAVNATGGSANSTLVDHTHSATSVVSDPGHNHDNGSFNRLLRVTGSGTVTATNVDPNEPDVTQSGNILSNTTGITVSTTVASAGSSALNANLPPYYALAYIMKL
jgi:hypothetical protein